MSDDPSASAGRRTEPSKVNRMPIIDMHTHTISKRVDPLVAGQYDPIDNPYRRDMSPESRATDAEQGKLLPRLMLDVAARREVMQRMGVDFQVIAPAPAQQHYWAAEELQVALSRAQNEDVAALVAQDPAHFAGMGTLPMRFFVYGLKTSIARSPLRPAPTFSPPMRIASRR